jgi:hypothetical protein
MTEQFTEINQEYVEEIYKAAKRYFCNGIYVKSDAHPCGWDFINFEHSEMETPSDVMDIVFGSEHISGGNYAYHDFEDKTLFEIITTVGLDGWCFEISGTLNW